MTDVVHTMRTHCMLFGAVRVWMMFGMEKDGAFGQGSGLLTSRTYADG